jgi:hypothetical protein
MTQRKLGTFDGSDTSVVSPPPASHLEAPSLGAEHRCPGYQNLYPPLSTFWPMPLHPASHTIEGNLVVKETVHEQSDHGEDVNSERRDEMRKLVAVTQMTLDGVMQALGGRLDA